ncbi:phospholipid scramblase family protein [Polaribacter sp.]|nr:phospholipid scramblase family protein [Polaribacter sp.]MDB9888296.1 phospholipid scramblase family protein [Polaribacter sp.]MDC1534267.1 phospholipid scramblase family protein [Polaribacter sp.]
MMNSIFFDSSTYFIDENINYFKYGNCFIVFNEKGSQVGFISEKISKGHKLLKHFLNKNIVPFQFEIKDSKGNLQSSIFKGWTFMLSPIVIKNEKAITIGFVKRKLKLFNPTFTIYNKNNEVIANIIGTFASDFFQIQDSTGKNIGSINKKWNGDMTGFFSTADKYNINLNSIKLESFNKNTILLGALIIDKVLK